MHHSSSDVIVVLDSSWADHCLGKGKMFKHIEEDYKILMTFSQHLFAYDNRYRSTNIG